MIRRDLLTGHWKPYLERALTLKPCYDGKINGGEVTCSFLKCSSISVLQYATLLPSLCIYCSCNYYIIYPCQIVARILQDTAIGKKYASDKVHYLSGY